MKKNKLLMGFTIAGLLATATPLVAQDTSDLEIDVTCVVAAGRPSYKFGGSLVLDEALAIETVSTQDLPLTISGSKRFIRVVEQLEPQDTNARVLAGEKVEYDSLVATPAVINYTLTLQSVDFLANGPVFNYGRSRIEIVNLAGDILSSDSGTMFAAESRSSLLVATAFNQVPGEYQYPGPVIDGEENIFRLGNVGNYANGAQIVRLTAKCSRS